VNRFDCGTGWNKNTGEDKNGHAGEELNQENEKINNFVNIEYKGNQLTLPIDASSVSSKNF
jgi:hypothetical protein